MSNKVEFMPAQSALLVILQMLPAFQPLPCKRSCWVQQPAFNLVLHSKDIVHQLLREERTLSPICYEAYT